MEPRSLEEPREQQALARRPSTPSLAMNGTMTNAAAESAHHQPKSQFVARPNSRIADKYVQNCVCMASACMALLLSSLPTRRLDRERRGITISETIASMIPAIERAGCSCPYIDFMASTAI